MVWIFENTRILMYGDGAMINCVYNNLFTPENNNCEIVINRYVLLKE